MHIKSRQNFVFSARAGVFLAMLGLLAPAVVVFPARAGVFLSSFLTNVFRALFSPRERGVPEVRTLKAGKTSYSPCERGVLHCRGISIGMAAVFPARAGVPSYENNPFFLIRKFFGLQELDFCGKMYSDS